MERTADTIPSNGIAVIGMSCRFPGADTPEQFWENLAAGKESVTFFSDEDLLAAGEDPERLNQPDYVKAGCPIQDIDRFDASLFGYSPGEARTMDPQHRLFLECAWRAVEDAGYPPMNCPGSVAVFAGTRMSTYANPATAALGSPDDFQTLIGNDKDYIASRVSYKLNLKGPSMAVQTACSTSLTAVHLACESILNGQCDMALAGGVALFLPQIRGYQYRPGMIFSQDGHCRAFDEGANGVVSGNGAGMVLLKSLAEALEDGDHIYAVILGTAVNNDGSSKAGYTAPSPEGQAAVIEEAMAVANASPDSISYVETHGTGTFLGDPIEVAALSRVFANAQGPCALGSVKTNIGHLDTAAGIASLIKTVLAVSHGEIPPSLNFNRPNPGIDFANSPFHVNTQLTPWPSTPCRAGVSSFGIGGTNVHVILESPPSQSRPPAPRDIPSHLLTLSARSREGLGKLAKRFTRELAHRPEMNPADLCFTANAGRHHYPWRLALKARTTKEFEEKLSARITDNGLPDAPAPINDMGKGPVFLFTGQGSQYPGMGRHLYQNHPDFQRTIDRCNELLLPQLDIPLTQLLFDPDSKKIHDTAYTQPALFALGYALANLWMSWGVTPGAVLGHSVGEYVAACLAGVFSLEDGLSLIAARGRLIQALPRNGRMKAIFAPLSVVKEALAPFSETVSIAAVNGPESIVISGLAHSVEQITAQLKEQSIPSTPLNTSHPFHSPLMAPILDEFKSVAAGIRYSPPRLPLVSNQTGMITDQIPDASYWTAHIRDTVQFHSGITHLFQQGYTRFIEMGPDPVLTRMANASGTPDHTQWTATMASGKDAWEQTLESLGSWYCSGGHVNWAAVHRPFPGARLSLPPCPFERESYWQAPAPMPPSPNSPDHEWQQLYTQGTDAARQIPDPTPERPLHDLSTLYAAAALNPLAGKSPDEIASATIEHEGDFIPRYAQLIQRLAHNIFSGERAEEKLATISQERLNQELSKVKNAYTGNPEIIEFIRRCGDHLPGILSGKVDPREVVFPGGSALTVETLYQDNDRSRFLNGIVLSLVQEKARQNSGLRILEIGAGTGATTAALLPHLSGNCRYDYTDISPLFLDRAREKFKGFPFVRYKCLDIEQSPESQGFTPGHYDLVVAANVLHATRNLDEVMSHVRALMAPGGTMVIREIIRAMPMFDITFGPLMNDVEDTDRRGISPFLGRTGWKALLHETGFQKTASFPNASHVDEAVIMAHLSGALEKSKIPTKDTGHPLLGQRLDSAQPIFDARILPTGHLANHRIQGHLLLPGAAFFDMALAAGRQSLVAPNSADSELVLTDMVFESPLIFPESNDPLPIQTLVFPDDNQGGEVKICSRPRYSTSNDWQCHAGGRLSTTSRLKVRSLAEITDRCSRPVSMGDLNAAFPGPPDAKGYPRVKNVVCGTGEALGTIELSRTAPGLHLPMEILDPCLRVLWAIFISRGIHIPKDSILLPMGVDRVCLDNAAHESILCHARLKSEQTTLEQGFTVDFNLYTPSGLRVAEFSGLHMGRVPQNAFEMPNADTEQQPFKVKESDVFYEINWQPREKPISNGSEENIPPDGWLILTHDRDHRLISDLEKQFKDQGRRALISSLEANEIRSRIQHLSANGSWGIADFTRIPPWTTPEADLPQAAAGSCNAFIQLIQSLGHTFPNRICIFTTDSQTVDSDGNAIAHGPLWGICRAAAAEYPDTTFSLVDLPPTGPPSAFELIEELETTIPEPEVALRNGKGYVPRLTPCRPGQTTPLQPKPDKTYLITGGTGGMGLALAGHLVKKGARHLVLLGRSQLAPRALEQISQLKHCGATIELETADVSDAQTLDRIIGERAASLAGVFHLAGVMNQTLVADLDMEKYTRATAAKIDGAWHLHQLTRKLPLDYFVLFSSISALMGRPGLGSYTAGNRFLDTLAQYRQSRGLAVQSINWGAFSHVGMLAQDKQGDRMRKSSGIRPFTPEQALTLFETSLSTGQVCIADIQWRAFFKNLSGSVPHLFRDIYQTQITAPQNSSRPMASNPQDDAEILKQLHTARPGQRQSLLTRYLTAKVAGALHVAPALLEGEHDLIRMGLDSLMFLRLTQVLARDLKVKLVPHEIFKMPTIPAMARAVREKMVTTSPEDIEEMPIVPDPASRYLPFDLTDIQQAYWVGRGNDMELGNIACHTYFESQCTDLNIHRYTQAWERLIQRHDMLRTIFLPTGQQQVLETVPPLDIRVADLRDAPPEMIELMLTDTRDEMSHRVMDTEQWPLFEVRITRLPENQARIHVGLDLLIADVDSLSMMMMQVAAWYESPDLVLPPLELTFRDYVLDEKKQRETPAYQKARTYWMEQIHTLPPAPDLPLAAAPDQIGTPEFTRRRFTLVQSQWHNLKTKAADAGLTPSGLLIAGYAEVLALWSASNEFTLNLTLFNRMNRHPQVNDIIGDFTSVILLDAGKEGHGTFSHRAAALQDRLWEGMAHRQFSGIQLLREMGQAHGRHMGASMPVVFTGNLRSGGAGSPSPRVVGDLIYNISQTPQVWLDNQVMETEGALTVWWDSIDSLFPESLVEDMFRTYTDFIERLAKEPLDSKHSWNNAHPCSPPEHQMETRTRVNRTEAPLSGELLHTLFAARAKEKPDAPALIGPNCQLSYGELAALAACIGQQLRNRGAAPGMQVAVVMEKGWEQAAAVLGILYSGAAYLPIDPAFPSRRRHLLMEDAQIRLVLTMEKLDRELEWPGQNFPHNVERICVDSLTPSTDDRKAGMNPDPIQSPEDLAYVIYTSGSTGNPKGVMIDHRGAVNTILDMNQRFNIGPHDRILAVSNLNFDLSVYDIFGLLAAGGSVIFPEPGLAKDPTHLAACVNNGKVTLWNSVPMLMQMLVSHLDSMKEAGSSALRLVLMSGDWIPLELPDQIRKRFTNARAVSLGGATEASIWSIFHPIDAPLRDWRSIPYGRPMVNQYFHILDKHLNHCPDWVAGNIYIGGKGLAKGYWHDPDKTNASFITHSVTGERLYKTGDLGRYHPDGTIEFLGREDFQVKVRGYRIELGEIETAIKQVPGVKDAVVTANPGPDGRKQLVGYLVPAHGTAGTRLFETHTADKHVMESLWNSLSRAGESWEADTPEALSPVKLEQFMEDMEFLAAQSIYAVLEKMGGFKKNEALTLDNLINQLGILPRFRHLMQHWLGILTTAGILQEQENGYLFPKTDSPARRQFHSSGIPELARALEQGLAQIPGLLRGETDPLEMLLSPDAGLTAAEMNRFNPAGNHYRRLIISMVRELIHGLSPRIQGQPIRILEIGTRSKPLVSDLLPLLDNDMCNYTYTDETAFFNDRIRREFQGNPILDTVLLDLNNDLNSQDIPCHEFDIILAADTLHRIRNLGPALERIKSLIEPGGFLIFNETTRNNGMMMLTAGLFEDGFSRLEDHRGQTGLPLMEGKAWCNELQEAGFEKVKAFPEANNTQTGQAVIVARGPAKVNTFVSERLSEILTHALPGYMVPSAWVTLNAIPLSANGKLDRNALPVTGGETTRATTKDNTPPSNPLEAQLAAIWQAELQCSTLGIHDNFFELGGDSLRAIQCINRLREEQGISLPLKDFFDNATIQRLAARISRTHTDPELEADIEEGLI